jgi:Glycosyl transferase family 2
MSVPSISVVVVSLAGTAELSRCLQALACQSGTGEIEIIVPCDDAHADAPKLESRFAGVRFPRLQGRRTPAEARAAGVKLARAPIVALTEDHCLPEPDWCAQILAGHASPHAAVGGTVEKQTPDKALNWAFFFSDYLRYMNPTPAGPAAHLTDCNVSYKRAALDEIQDEWCIEFHENLVHGALRERGHSLWLCPGAVVRQSREFSLGAAVWDRYAFARLFASTRVEKAPVSRRTLFAATTPLLPFLLVARIAVQIARKRRCVFPFLRSLPHIVLIASVWAWGELVGYITGRPVRVLAAQ